MSVVGDDALPRWADPQWKAEILGWAVDRLAARRLVVAGDPQQVKARPWSTVFRLPTSAGPVWLKANAAGSRYEAALVDALSRWVPDNAVAPLAVETDRGWLLLRDGGPTLRSLVESHRPGLDLAGWERLLVEHAHLQRALEPYVDDMLALGVPDNRLPALPALLADLLADHDAMWLGRDGGLTEAEHDRLLAKSGEYVHLCAELDAVGVAPTLQHDDLHDNNVFAPVDNGHPSRVFDWGDAVVTHPFMVLRVALGTVAATAGAPELGRLRDAYLEPWTDVAALPELRDAVRLAVRVVAVVRAASWRRALSEATPAGRGRWGSSAGEWLTMLDGPTPVEP